MGRQILTLIHSESTKIHFEAIQKWRENESNIKFYA